MPGATFSRVKNWNPEVLSNTDLNAEIDNILNNLNPDGIFGYSENAAEMKLQTSPGELGSESLATSLAGEIERLRYVIRRLIGGDVDYWYEEPPTSLSDLVASQGSGIPRNRIVSGLTTGNSSQLVALRPAGTSAAVTLAGSGTPFIYYINGNPYSITANVVVAGLSLASGTNNTCSFNYTGAAAQAWTKALGMYGGSIPVDGMQSGLAALVGSIAGLKVGNEYFMGYIASTSSITNAARGYFFNSTPTAIPAVGLTDNDEIKLMRLAWIFANTNSSLSVTYNNPTISAEQPSSPTTGDFWFDLDADKWKTYNSTSWVDANALLVGVTMQDTANCVAARTLDSFMAISDLCSMGLQRVSNTVIQASEMFSEVSVFGSTNRFINTRPSWDMATDLEAGVTESANSNYYCYMKENGLTFLSDKPPISRRDLAGLYYPTETWRCIGNVYNDSSTHFSVPARTFTGDPGLDFFPSVPTVSDQSRSASFSPMPQFVRPELYLLAQSTAFATATGLTNYGDFQTLSLTPGLWMLSGGLRLDAAATPASVYDFEIGISTATGNSFPERMAGINSRMYATPTTPFWYDQYAINNYIVEVNVPTAFYLKAKLSATSATSGYNTYHPVMQAVRMDRLNGLPL